MNPQDERKLERFVNNAVRDLPSRRAPFSLENRVRDEIARRAALPWWRKSFLSWPLPARAVFVVACAGLVRLAFMSSTWFSVSVDASSVKTAVSADLHWLGFARALLTTVNESAGAVLSSISPLWLYGGLATIAGLYLALFGLGAAAYRTLYASR